MELKPCPFCGGHAEFLERKMPAYLPWGIKCSVCGITNNHHWSYDDAVKTWNTRADDTTIQSLKDENARAMAVIDTVMPLIDAAHGLSFGTDWNNGTHALTHGYRKKLLEALPAALATAKAFKEKVS
jgi:Lar family restriction alleviation protein